LRTNEDVPYKAQYVEELLPKLRKFETEEYAYYLDSVRDWINEIAGRTPNPRALLIDGEVIGVGGVSVSWNGVGEGWFIGSQDVNHNPLYVYKRTMLHLKDAREKNNLHRIQATTVTGNNLTYRWAIKLGFVFEGILYKYGPNGHDYNMYGSIS